MADSEGKLQKQTVAKESAKEGLSINYEIECTVVSKRINESYDRNRKNMVFRINAENMINTRATKVLKKMRIRKRMFN